MATDRARRARVLIALGVALGTHEAFAQAPAEPAAPDSSTDAAAPTAQPDAAPTPADAQPAPEPKPDPGVLVHGDAADALEQNTGSGARITERDLQREQPISTAEALRRVAGVNVRTEDGMGLRLNVGMRGLSPTRGRLILMQEDGVPVVVSPYGEPELYYSTPVERVQRIDVLKGHEVVMSGPQTVGGVINLYTWAPPTRQEWSLEVDYGQRGYNKQLARYGNAVDDVRYVVQISNKQGDGFRNMPFRATDFLGKVAFPTGNGGEATLKFSAYDEVSHTTYVGLTQPMFRQDPRQDTVISEDLFGFRRYELSLQHEQRLGDKTRLRTTLFAYTVNMRLYQQDFDRGRVEGVEYMRVAGPEGVDGSAIFIRQTRALRDRVYNVAGVEPQLEHRFFTGQVEHKVVVGARAMADIATRKLASGANSKSESGDLLSDDTTSILGLAAYAQDRIALRDDLLLTPAVRVEHSRSRREVRRLYEEGVASDVDLTGTSTASGVMPSLGFAWGNPSYSVFSGVHSGYSPPRVSQAITPTGQDAGLSAERSMNYELGTRLRPVRWLRTELTGFLTQFDNQLISNNTLSGSAAEFKNGGRTQHIGGELTAIARLTRRMGLPLDIDVSGQYTYSRSTFVTGLNDGRFVPYSPEHQFSVTVDAEHTSGLGGQASLSYVGKQFADEQNTVEPDISGRAGLIPAFKVLDLGARYHYKPEHIELMLTVKNALDDVYLASRLPNGIFTAGFRQAMVGLKWFGP